MQILCLCISLSVAIEVSAKIVKVDKTFDANHNLLRRGALDDRLSREAISSARYFNKFTPVFVVFGHSIWSHLLKKSLMEIFIFCAVLEQYFSTAVTVLLVPTAIANSRTQPAITCSKLTIETLEQGVKYVQS